MSRKEKVFKYQNNYNVIYRETAGEFSASLFENEYIRTSRIVTDIVKRNLAFLDEKDKNERETRYPQQIYNVVSFLGDRGTGKTSIMVSYVDFLENYKGVVTAENMGKFALDIGKREIEFYKLNMINAAMLSRNEKLLDIILAQMWDAYDNENQFLRTKRESYDAEQMARKFQNLKKDYGNYLKMSNDSNESNISKLHDLSVSINLRNSFYELVQEYLQYFTKTEKSFLIISIDDIDMAGRNCFSILEQISLFLSIPRVMIMITADIRRLNQICGHYYFQTYVEKESTIDDSYNTNLIIKGRDTFANDYLEKVIALDMRVNMPQFKSIEPTLEPGNLGMNLKKKLLVTLYQHKIEFDGDGDKHHFLEEDTLRANITMLHELERSDGKENDSEQVISWLYQKLKDQLVPRISSAEIQNDLQKIFNVDVSKTTRAVIAFLEGIFKQEDPSDNVFSVMRPYKMNNVFELCKMLEEESFEFQPVVNVIITYYTLLYRELYTDSFADSQKTAEKNEIFDGTVFGFSFHDYFADTKMYQNLFGYDVIKQRYRLSIDVDIDRSFLEKAVSFNQASEKYKWNYKKMVEKIFELLKENRNKIIMYQVLLLFLKDASQLRKQENLFTSEFDIKKSNAIIPVITGRQVDLGDKRKEGKIVSYKLLIYIEKFDEFSLDYYFADTGKIAELLENFKNQFLECFISEFCRMCKNYSNTENSIKRYNISKEQEQTIIKECRERFFNGGKESLFLSEELALETGDNSKKCNCLFPMQNIEMRYNIEKEIGDQNFRMSNDNVFDSIADVYKLILEHLKRYGEYFGSDAQAYYERLKTDPLYNHIFMGEKKEKYRACCAELLRDNSRDARLKTANEE